MVTRCGWRPRWGCHVPHWMGWDKHNQPWIQNDIFIPKWVAKLKSEIPTQKVCRLLGGQIQRDHQQWVVVQVESTPRLRWIHTGAARGSKWSTYHTSTLVSQRWMNDGEWSEGQRAHGEFWSNSDCSSSCNCWQIIQIIVESRCLLRSGESIEEPPQLAVTRKFKLIYKGRKMRHSEVEREK